MTTDVTHATAADLAAAIAAGETTSVAVTAAHLDRIAAVDGEVHAFLHVDAERALEQAAVIDHRIAGGEKLGPLAGVPLALKDILTYRGAPTTCGSKILEGWLPPYDATVTRRLLDADLVILLNRPDLYDKESDRAGEADVDLAKHRNGPTRTLTVAFQGHYSRFADMRQP